MVNSKEAEWIEEVVPFGETEYLRAKEVLRDIPVRRASFLETLRGVSPFRAAVARLLDEANKEPPLP